MQKDIAMNVVIELSRRITEFLFLVEDGRPIEPRFIGWAIMALIIMAILAVHMGYYQGYDPLPLNVLFSIVFGAMITVILMAVVFLVLVFPTFIAAGIVAIAFLAGLVVLASKLGEGRKWKK